MTAAQALTAPRRREWRLPVVLGIAVRELRSGIGGFGIFIACVALGVTVITGVGAVSDALRGGFEAQGEATPEGWVGIEATAESDEDEDGEPRKGQAKKKAAATTPTTTTSTTTTAATTG